MKTVVFTEDFATKKKGDECIFSDALASNLVRRQKIAKYKADVKEKPKKAEK